jgi:hypothetical protein
MDFPSFKDVLNKLKFIRDYSSLVLPVVLTAVAVVVLVLTPLTGARLRNQINKDSISVGNKVQSLQKTAVSSSQSDIERDYQQAYKEDAEEIARLAMQSSQRQLLSYKIFPAPKDTSTMIFDEFGRQFRQNVNKLLTRINARDCPTDTELQRSLQGSGSSRSDRAVSSLSRMSGEVEGMIQEELCRARANSIAVYANPQDLSGYEFWDKASARDRKGQRFEYTGMEQAVKDCWYSQLAYWIIEDVIDTIAACNSGSNSVFTSPVKRLLAVNFTSADVMTMGTSEKKASYVFSSKDGLSVPWTGRICDDYIDVVHFNLSVVLSTKAVLPFIQQLCSAKEHKFSGFGGQEPEQVFRHNQITVLESNINSIDRNNKTHQLYRYGEDAIVELNLICEYIFNKAGYDEIKPESIKKSAKEQDSGG